MGAMGKRVKYKEEFRQEILDAARDIFVNEGYERFSIRKLSKKIEYSSTIIYLYFKDKDDLLYTVCEEFAEHFFANLTNIRTTYHDPLEALQQALLYLIALGFNNPNQYNFFFISSSKVYGSSDEFMGKKSMARNSYFVFREIVRHRMVTGKLQEIDLDVLTQALIVATYGLAALTVYKTSFPSVDRKVLAHTLVEGLLRGYQR